jgi:hypothetical protein
MLVVTSRGQRFSPLVAAQTMPEIPFDFLRHPAALWWYKSIPTNDLACIDLRVLADRKRQSPTEQPNVAAVRDCDESGLG